MKNRGFTVVEVLITIVILGILGAIAYRSITSPSSTDTPAAQPVAGEPGSTEWLQKDIKQNTKKEGAWCKAVSQPVLNELTGQWEITFLLPGNKDSRSFSKAVMSYTTDVEGLPEKVGEVFIIQRDCMTPQWPLYVAKKVR